MGNIEYGKIEGKTLFLEKSLKMNSKEANEFKQFLENNKNNIEVIKYMGNEKTFTSSNTTEKLLNASQIKGIELPNVECVYSFEFIENKKDLKFLYAPKLKKDFSLLKELTSLEDLTVSDKEEFIYTSWLPEKFLDKFFNNFRKQSKFKTYTSKNGIQKIKMTEDNMVSINRIYLKKGKADSKTTEKGFLNRIDEIKDNLNYDVELRDLKDIIAGNSCKCDPEDIHQKGSGDCWLLATLAAMAKTNHKKIAECLKLSKDEKFVTVRLWKTHYDKEEIAFIPESRVDIKFPLDSLKRLRPSNSKLWVTVFEKAFSILLGVEDISTTYGDKDLSNNLAFLDYKPIKGNYSAFASATITGKKYKIKILEKNAINALIKKIESGKKRGDVFAELKEQTSINELTQKKKVMMKPGKYRVEYVNWKYSDIGLLLGATLYHISFEDFHKHFDKIEYKNKDSKNIKTKETKSFNEESLKNNLYNKIKKKLREGFSVETSTNEKVKEWKERPCFLLNNHAYGVLGVSESGQVTLYEPNKVCCSDGIHTVSFDDFFKYFCRIHYKSKETK